MQRCLLAISIVLLGALGGCANRRPQLIWDVPAYRHWASTASDSFVEDFVPPPGMSEAVARSAFRQGREVAMIVYKHRLSSSASEGLLGIIDSQTDGRLLEDPVVRQAVERYAREGVFVTKWSDDPTAAAAHRALDLEARKPGSPWTHSQPAASTSEAVTSYRLRRTTMPVYSTR